MHKLCFPSLFLTFLTFSIVHLVIFFKSSSYFWSWSSVCGKTCGVYYKTLQEWKECELSVLAEQFWHLWEEEQAILSIWIALKVPIKEALMKLRDLRKAADCQMQNEISLPWQSSYQNIVATGTKNWQLWQYQWSGSSSVKQFQWPVECVFLIKNAWDWPSLTQSCLFIWHPIFIFQCGISAVTGSGIETGSRKALWFPSLHTELGQDAEQNDLILCALSWAAGLETSREPFQHEFFYESATLPTCAAGITVAGVQCREGVVAVWTLLGTGSRALEVLQTGAWAASVYASKQPSCAARGAACVSWELVQMWCPGLIHPHCL